MELINLKKKTKNLKIRPISFEEKIIWDFIKERKLYNLKFKRNIEIGIYTLNFYSPEIEFGIEIDDKKHTRKYNLTHDEFFTSNGIKVIRVTSSEIKSNLEDILKKINLEVKDLKN